MRRRGVIRNLRAAVLIGTAVLLCAGLAAAGLSEKRAARRASLKTAALAGEVAPFRILVVPVDFADARFPDDWDEARLSAQLAGPGETLESYFDAASRGRCDVTTLLAPVVHLDGDRRAYSDLGYFGYFRTRAMAQEAMEGAASTIPFHLADGDGDGDVDGVLILHAAPGLENDHEDGLIVPLQFWTEEPVLSNGTAADFYAVASARSGLGIWVHEAAHLLGLDDRYQLGLDPPEGEPLAGDAGWGGLGRFSLMAAGHLGGDAGEGPALLDAYSALQLGWADETLLDPADSGDLTLAPGEVLRWDVPGTDGAESFLLETRGATSSHTFDAGIPAGRLLVYHVDRDVPDDVVQDHLRVRLVEADGDDAVADGLTLGVDADLFPRDGVRQDWTPETTPGTGGYGAPSGLALGAIRPVEGGVAFHWGLADGAWSVEASFDVSAADTLLVVRARTSVHPATLSAVCTALAGGTFADGPTVQRDLEYGEGGVWTFVSPPVWRADPAEESRIRLSFLGDDVPSDMTVVRTWTGLDPDPAVTDWASWTLGVNEAAGSSWRLWDLDGLVLACVDDDSAPADWPDVSYANGTDAWIASPAFTADDRVLVMLHHVDVPEDEPGFSADGCAVELVTADGLVTPVAPVDGYGGGVPGWSGSSLRGRPAFTRRGDLDDLDRPVWRVDVFDLSPWAGTVIRLRLRLAADALWRGRGWYVRSLEFAEERPRTVPARTDDAWTWETPFAGVTSQLLSLSVDGGGTWVPAGSPTATTWPAASLQTVLRDLDATAGLLRIRCLADPGAVDLGPVAFRRDEALDLGANLGRPWPNPAVDEVRIPISVPDGVADAVLSIHDLRGRTVRKWRPGPGGRIVSWDGRDDRERRLPAGRYLVRLETGAHHSTRSLTLLP